MDMMGTVRSNHGMACPKCGSDEQLDVAATIWVPLVRGGTDPDLAHAHDHEWDDNSAVVCQQCGHQGLVKDFMVQESVA